MKNKGYSQKQIADKVKADPKTIRKYSAESSPPSSKISLHDWTTRQNPFDSVWPEVVGFLENSPQIQALTMFEYLQRTYPGVYQDGQKRSLERRFRNWRGTDGPAKEVYFGQNHTPGKLGASDFSHMTECEVTIAGVPFVHMIFHFVLTYSNWESVTVCLTESFEGLSEGLQNAMWELNGAPTSHRTDRLSAAVKNLKGTPSEFTERY